MKNNEISKRKYKSKFIITLQRFYRRFIKIQGEPKKIALGFALGLFIGVSPTMGIQTAIAVFFAALFKWNKISAAIGVWISNPVTAPFLYSFTYFFGAKLIGIGEGSGATNGLVASSFSTLFQKAPETLWFMSVGGVVLGPPIAFVGYVFAYFAIKNYQDKIRIKLARRKERTALKRVKSGGEK
jgi:uncharacterized protein (DUF2062 family)